MEEISVEVQEKIAELEAQNAERKSSFDNYYLVIGKNYYEKAEGAEAAIAEAAAKLDELNAQIKKTEKDILRLQGVRLCPKCESIVEDGAVFCGECGARLEEVKAAQEGEVCPRCGASNEKGKKFCVICGEKLDGQETPAFNIDVAVSEAAPTQAVPEVAPEPVQAPASIFCPNCGTQLPADAIFCGECGTRL